MVRFDVSLYVLLGFGGLMADPADPAQLTVLVHTRRNPLVQL